MMIFKGRCVPLNRTFRIKKWQKMPESIFCSFIIRESIIYVFLRNVFSMIIRQFIDRFKQKIQVAI